MSTVGHRVQGRAVRLAQAGFQQSEIFLSFAGIDYRSQLREYIKGAANFDPGLQWLALSLVHLGELYSIDRYRVSVLPQLVDRAALPQRLYCRGNVTIGCLYLGHDPHHEAPCNQISAAA